MMAESPWWRHLVQAGLWLILMSLIMGWLSRSRGRPRKTGRSGVLEHPRSVLALGLVCSGFFLALAALSAIFPGKSGSPLITLFFLGFAGFGFYPIIEYSRVRHWLEAEGLRSKTLFGKRFLRWEEVVRVRYSPAAKWFRLEGARGEVVRVSVLLTSLPEFAATVLQRVARERIDPESVRILKETASGRPPSIWT